MSVLGRKIRELRLNLNLNQAEFAALIGSSQGSVSKWESGREVPRTDTLFEIADKTKYPISEFLGGDARNAKRPGAIRSTAFVGDIRFSYGVENSLWAAEDRFDLELPFDPSWERLDLQGWFVRGKSPWPSYPDGTAIITAVFDWLIEVPKSIESDWYLKPSNEDNVVVSLLQVTGLHVVTLKKIVIDDNGSMWLWPLDESREDRELPLQATDESLRDGTIEILGLVIGSVRSEVDALRLSIPF